MKEFTESQKIAFFKYEKVRKSGRYHMIMEAEAACKAAKLSFSDYLYVIKNYSELKKALK